MSKILAVFLGISFFLYPALASATEEFYVRQNVDYKFDSLGRPTITFHISLSNNTAKNYASRYELELVGENPQNISGQDSGGPLKIVTSPASENTTRIVTNFNDIVTGLGKPLNFTLQYQGKPAIHNGQVWEINLPKLSNPSSVDEYLLNLIVPPNFGQPAYLSPPPSFSDGNKYSYTKDQLSQTGVVAAFGNFQTFSFQIKYNITGPSRITLPADTAYQRIFFDSLSPQPNSITADSDGNWLAEYPLKSDQLLEVTATGQAHLLIEPISSFTDSPPEKYLFSTAYWPAENPQIKKLASSLKTPRQIYDYVVKTIDYDYASTASKTAIRKGALEALSSGIGVCTEFTDLFIALSRSAGIPAREVNGYVHATDSRLRPSGLSNNTFHAWPQYWDTTRKVWVSVDPTWGRTTGGVDYFTKFDLNHISFITRGLSDSQPALSISDIQVSYGSYREYSTQPAIFTWLPPSFIIPYLPASFRLRVSNPNSQALHISSVTIPPFGSTILTTSFTLTHPFDFNSKSVSLLVGSHPMTYNIPQSLFLLWQIGFAILISLTLIAGGISLQKCFRPRHLRR